MDANPRLFLSETRMVDGFGQRVSFSKTLGFCLSVTGINETPRIETRDLLRRMAR